MNRVFHSKADSVSGRSRFEVLETHGFVWKRALDQRDNPILLTEASLHANLSGVGVSTPVSSFVKDGPHGCALMMGKVSGRPLDGWEECNIKKLGPKLRKIHNSFPVSGAGGIGPILNDFELKGSFASWQEYLTFNLDEHCNHVRHLLPDDCRDKVLRAIESLGQCRMSFLHGDINAKNVMLNDRGDLVFIDWEDALVGDALYELAFWATFNPRPIWPALFRSYYGHGAEIALTREELLRFWTYYTRISICKLVILSKVGYTDLTRGQERVKTGTIYL